MSTATLGSRPNGIASSAIPEENEPTTNPLDALQSDVALTSEITTTAPASGSGTCESSPAATPHDDADLMNAGGPSASTTNAGSGSEVTLQFPAGIYQGTLDSATGLRHGRGAMRYTNGNIYQGEWRHGAPHGKGVKLFRNGDAFDGEWVAGRREGEGTYTFAAGHVFNGTYANDECNGFGRLILANAAGCYEGEWTNGRKHGSGTERDRTGEVYEGTFVEGLRHGRGKLTDPRGHVRCDGAWDRGRFVPAPAAAAAGAGGGGPVALAPLLDRAGFDALIAAGVDPNAVAALSMFDQGMQRSIGGLVRGVEGMESHLDGLCGALESLLQEAMPDVDIPTSSSSDDGSEADADAARE